MTLDEVLRQPEQAQRSIIRDSVGQWFLHGDFALIEGFAEEARTRKLRTSSGLWIIGLLYGGIDQVADYKSVRSDPEWDRLESVGRRWLRAYPKSPTAKIAYAAILQNRAWFYRGGGYASAVSDAQFAAFHRQIDKAREYQLSTREVAKVDPDWYLELLATCRLERHSDRAKFERTFREAVRVFPDFYPLYFEAMTYYLPKWRGSIGELEHFARGVMQGRDRRTGHMLYARIYWYASESQFKDAIFVTSAAHWDAMREGFETIVHDFPDAWNIKNHARFACLVGDQGTTRDAFDRIQEPVKEAWESTEQYRQCEHFAGRSST